MSGLQQSKKWNLGLKNTLTKTQAIQKWLLLTDMKMTN